MAHIGNTLVLLLLCFVYFVMPAYFEDDADWAGLVNLDGGAMFLALAVALYRSGRNDPAVHRRYLNFRLCALVVSGAGLSASGMVWFLYMPDTFPYRSVSLAGALLSLLAGEVLFLCRNSWRFLPQDLR